MSADIWIVLVEDRHNDVDALPFSTGERAIGYARAQAAANAHDHDQVTEDELTPAALADGVVLSLTYCIEGDSVSVIRRTVDSEETPAI